MSEDLSIFHEIDEALKIEKVERFFLKHGKTILFICFAIIILTIVNVLRKEHDKKIASEQSGLILQANRLAKEAKYQEAIDKISQAENGLESLNFIAKLRHAEILILAEKPDEAGKIYSQIASEDKFGKYRGFSDLASINDYILASNHKTDKTLKPLGKDAAFGFLADELTAIELIKQGKKQEARELLDNIRKDGLAPKSQAMRAGELFDSIKK